MSTHFNRPLTTDLSHGQMIDAAYRTAGLRPPSRVHEITALLAATPTAAQVTDQMAQEALTATDPEAFYTGALERIATAHAADSLRHRFAERLEEHQRRTALDTIGQTVTDVSPAFDKLSKAFADAAKKLPEHAPLDVEANVDAGTADAFKLVRDTLRILGNFAAIYRADVSGDFPRGLNLALPLVSIPDATIERLAGFARTTANEAQLSGTRAIREVTDALDKDADLALVRVARGDWPAITLTLAAPEEYRRRILAARNAYRTQPAEQDPAVLIHR